MKFTSSIILPLGTIVFLVLPESVFGQRTYTFSTQKNVGEKFKTLHDAVENGGSERNLLRLIERGDDVNLMDDLGWTPLQLASFHGDQNSVRILLENGAKVNISNELGETSLHWAASQGYDRIVDLLIKNGADVNSKNINGLTPLHEAVQWGKEETISALLRNKANRHIKNNNGQYPIDLAKSDQKAIDLLLNRTASIACNRFSDLLENSINEQNPILDNRIIGGKRAMKGEFQWMTSLGYGNKTDGFTYFCGGVIISDFFVLTAAHCAAPSFRYNRFRPSPTIIRYGKLNRRDEDGEARDVETIHLHPNYSPDQHWKNDIALIRVKGPILFSEDIRPACLQTDIRDESPDVKLLVAGWGSVSKQPLRTRLEGLVRSHGKPLFGSNINIIEASQRERDIDEVDRVVKMLERKVIELKQELRRLESLRCH